jgi:cytoskeletal protein CcmA (bactofilin family)
MSFFGNRRQVEQSPIPQSPVEKAQLPKPSVPPTPVGFETVLGANSVMEGTLRSNANVRLDGIFTGTLEITGNVLVGETAKINADINARNISIAGAVRGNVSGKKVQLLRTGRIWGDIQATALTTEEGAFIDGKITMVSHDVQPPTAESGLLESGTPEATLSVGQPSELEPSNDDATIEGVAEIAQTQESDVEDSIDSDDTGVNAPT